jgi:hypothetical protein
MNTNLRLSAKIEYFSHVLVPPRITPFNFGDDIQEGMRVQTMCTSTQGDQPFNITWYRDSKALKNGEQTDSTASSSSSVSASSFNSNHQRHHFDERTIEINTIQSFSSILTIHNITSQHNGNYTCQISNPAGVVDYTVALSVSGKRKKRSFIHMWFLLILTISFITLVSQ